MHFLVSEQYIDSIMHGATIKEMEQCVLSGNYSVQRNQEGTDSSVLNNVTDISHSPINRF